MRGLSTCFFLFIVLIYLYGFYWVAALNRNNYLDRSKIWYDIDPNSEEYLESKSPYQSFKIIARVLLFMICIIVITIIRIAFNLP